MAIKLIANYSKRLGLPGYSSLQFSVSVETELVTTDDVAGESELLYQRLQSTVDEQMLHTGFVPPGDYGMDPPPENHSPAANGSAPGNVTQVANWQRGPAWKCSDKQKDLILKLVEEHQLDKNGIEALAVERFGKGVRLLNKVEASGLIDELLDTHGGSGRSNPGKRQAGSAYNGARGANPGIVNGDAGEIRTAAMLYLFRNSKLLLSRSLHCLRSSLAWRFRSVRSASC